MRAWLRDSVLLIAACWATDGLLFGRALALDRTVAPLVGVALGGLLVGGYRLVPAVFLGFWGAHAIAPPPAGEVEWHGFLSAAFATLQAVFGAALVRQFCPRPLALVRFREILLFLLIAGPFSCVLAATLHHAVSDWLAVEVWLRTWSRDALGGLLVTPVVLALFARPRAVWRPRFRTVAVPLLLLAAAVVGLHRVAVQTDADRTRRHLTHTAEDTVRGVQAEGRRLATILAAYQGWVGPDPTPPYRVRELRRLFPAAAEFTVVSADQAPADVRAVIPQATADAPLAAGPISDGTRPRFVVVYRLAPPLYLTARVDPARLVTEAHAAADGRLAARLTGDVLDGPPLAGEARHPVTFANRSWQLVVTADAAYLRTRATPFTWLAVATSLVAVALLAALFLALTGQTALVQAEVARGTKELSELHRTQAEVEAALNAARQEAALGRLAGGVAHEFNNLFTGVLGHTSRARDLLAPGHAAHAELHKVEASVVQAGELCQQILAFTGRGTTVRQTLDLAEFLRDVTADAGPRLPNAPEVVVEPAPTGIPLVADALLLRRLLVNLLTNAAEAYAQPGGRIVVRCGVSHDIVDPTPIWLSVADAGCGMAADVQDRAFEPFYSTKFTGRGLGLAAVRGIAQTHEGTATLVSEVGGGTTVLVRFANRTAWDLASTPPPSRHPTQPNVKPAPLPAAVQAGLVLVVDDDPTVRELAALTLRAGGCEVLTAEHGEDALKLYARHGDRVRLVVLDLLMPQMDGSTTLVNLRRRSPRLPVILMSGYSDLDLSGEFGNGTPTALLRKPFRPSDLLACVAELFLTPTA